MCGYTSAPDLRFDQSAPPEYTNMIVRLEHLVSNVTAALAAISFSFVSATIIQKAQPAFLHVALAADRIAATATLGKIHEEESFIPTLVAGLRAVNSCFLDVVAR
jgi:hypothetical protein